jgi:hypothetical protein
LVNVATPTVAKTPLPTKFAAAEKHMRSSPRSSLAAYHKC